MATYTREQLLALTPRQYLAQGVRDSAGNVRSELTGIWATAAAVQLEARAVAPQEMRITYEAWKQVAEGVEAAGASRPHHSLAEALDVARAVMNQPNNPALVEWLLECADHLPDERDLPLLLAHMLAATKQSTVFLALGGGIR